MKNKYKITKINYRNNVQCYCRLGRKLYNARIEVNIYPKDILINYINIDNYIDSISGQENIIEELCMNIREFFIKQYEPKKLEVIVKAESSVHSPVEVETYYEEEN